MGEMKSQGIQPDVVTYNLIIKGLAERGNICGCSQVMDQMELQQIQLENVTFNPIIHKLAELGDIGGCERVISIMRSKGIQPNATTYKTVIVRLADRSDIDGCKQVMDRIKRVMADMRAHRISPFTMYTKSSPVWWTKVTLVDASF